MFETEMTRVQRWMAGALMALTLAALPGMAWAKGGGGDSGGHGGGEGASHAAAQTQPAPTAGHDDQQARNSTEPGDQRGRGEDDVQEHAAQPGNLPAKAGDQHQNEGEHQDRSTGGDS
ncbi:MAG: hypothetical protein KGJ86_12925, partial [Chloroflexota bacterium]|nr:hypothetical protein [Chloroflexota bacterium]